MNKTLYNILPVTEDILSRASLWKVGQGNPSVAIGIYAAVLHVLNNMDRDLLLVAKDDAMGRKIQELNLITRKRAPKKSGDLYTIHRKKICVYDAFRAQRPVHAIRI